MNFRKRMATICLISLWFCSTHSTAQPASTLDALESASVRALVWFKSLAAPIGEIVAAEKRTQLLEALSDLSKDLYAIEQDKQVFVQLLKREKMDQQAIVTRTEKLMTSIDNARASLARVGPLLRQQHRIGGVQVETLLSNAAIDRKMWVSDLYGAPADPIKRQKTIAEGERALKALHDANVELSVLITKL
ncbi:MAG: hypothetical protein ABWY27_20090 [Telluria sp.]